VTQAEGGRGWGVVVLLALATMILSVVQPVLLIFIPLALLLVGLPPRRPVLLALAGLIGWLTFREVPAEATLWYFERGWSLLVGGWFLLLVVLLPGWRFLPRALGALAGAAATAAAFVVANRGGFAQVDALLSEQLRSAARNAVAVWTRAVGPDRVSDELAATVRAAAEFQVRLYPAMLALASLAALGVAWWAYGRLGRGERAPLGSLREFRFTDELVWLLIGSIVVLGLPLDAVATRIGENVLTFMAVLYALRGAAVLLVIGGVPGPLGMAVGALLVVFLYPFVMATAFLVGLSDTWLDIRKRREQAASRPGS
jgi:hypothetical protein